MSFSSPPVALPQPQRDLRDIQHTVRQLQARLERDCSRHSQHAAALLAAVRYKLLCLETTLAR